MDSISFLHAIEETRPKIIDRVVALIWFHGNGDDESAVKLRTLCEEIETAGFAKQNQTRLRAALKKDRRVLSKKDDCFVLNAKHKSKVEEQYGEHARIRKLRKSDAVLPTDLFSQAKGYIQKVVLQLNASYDHNLFDCTAVMCRRLLETLIIEAYEHSGKADSIKGVSTLPAGRTACYHRAALRRRPACRGGAGWAQRCAIWSRPNHTIA